MTYYEFLDFQSTTTKTTGAQPFCPAKYLISPSCISVESIDGGCLQKRKKTIWWIAKRLFACEVITVSKFLWFLTSIFAETWWRQWPDFVDFQVKVHRPHRQQLSNQPSQTTHVKYGGFLLMNYKKKQFFFSYHDPLATFKHMQVSYFLPFVFNQLPTLTWHHCAAAKRKQFGHHQKKRLGPRAKIRDVVASVIPLQLR